MKLTFRFPVPDESRYQDWRFQEFRHFAVLVGVATSLLAVSLWGWDWVHDPAGAPGVLDSRLMMGGVLALYPLGILARLPRAALAWLLYLVALTAEGLFLHLLTALQGGLVYGIAGFMYWFMLPILLGFPLGLGANLAGTLALALLPNLLVLAGLAPGFELAKFNVLIGPTCGIILFVHITLDQLFRQIFRSRIGAEEALARQQEATRALEQALARVKQMSGLIPICSNCKKIRDDRGYWNRLETYLSEHTDAGFSHSICPDCMQILYPDYLSEGGAPGAAEADAPEEAPGTPPV